MGVGAAAGDRRPTVDGGAADPVRGSAKPAAPAKPKIDIHSGPDAWKSDPAPMQAPQIPASEPGTPADSRSEPGVLKSDPPPIPPDEYDGDAGGPRSLDEVIFD